MKILAIDTATEACSVALLNDAEMSQKIEIQPTGHSRLVLQMVDKILVDAGLELGNLDLVAVNNGPGSFTGVRIGLGVAQGLAYGANLPVLGICSLEILAVSITSGLVLPAIDARMGQIYCSLYVVKEECRLKQVQNPVVTYPGQIPFLVEKPVVGLGSGWDVYAGSIKSATGINVSKIVKNCYPQAQHSARLARLTGLESATAPCFLEAAYIRNDIANKV